MRYNLDFHHPQNIKLTLENFLKDKYLYLVYIPAHIDYLLVQKNKTTVELDIINEKFQDIINEQKSILSLFEISDIVFFRWRNDEQWSIDYVSKNVNNLLGYTNEEFMLGEINYTKCISEDDLQRVIKEVQEGQSKDFFKHELYKYLYSK